MSLQEIIFEPDAEFSISRCDKWADWGFGPVRYSVHGQFNNRERYRSKVLTSDEDAITLIKSIRLVRSEAGVARKEAQCPNE